MENEKAMANNAVQNKVSDPATIVGIVLAFGLVLTAIYIGGSPAAFADPPSILIVIAGTFCLTTACFSISEVMHAQGTIMRTVFYSKENISHSARRAIELAELARKKGLLGMEQYMDLAAHNNLLNKGLRMLIDGMKPDDVDAMLEQEMHSIAERHNKTASILRKSAEISPAMGLIGTLIGLVQMLGNLDDPSSIGPAMAVALLTTFYGAVMAYMLFAPLASKLERNNQDEMLTYTIYLKAIASISRKENPRQLEMLINSLIPPSKRIHYFK